ncbi:MAG: phage tail sheath family protein [Chitinophagaceae bacterium]|nr:phage tail sheath family protein [Chitinophagaceae bacterium]
MKPSFRFLLAIIAFIPFSLNAQIQKPGVYIEEINKFPPSIADVETAIPVFIGYTEKADLRAAGDLHFVAHRIKSLLDFEQFYGKDFAAAFSKVQLDINNKVISAEPASSPYILYYSIQQFYNNGGGHAYIISIGGYGSALQQADFLQGVDVAEKEDEPTLLAFPDAVNLPGNGLYTVQQKALQQAGRLMDRFCVFDIKYATDKTSHDQVVAEFRNNIGNSQLKYGAAYTPFLNAGVMSSAVSYPQWKNVLWLGANRITLSQLTTDPAILAKIAALENMSPADPAYRQHEKELGQAFPVMKNISDALKSLPRMLPPSGAVCGVYSSVDRDRGVWKAPANVSVNNVRSLAVAITDRDQETLNVDANAGKSINVIRAFTGRGTLVWGARTLMGNDNEWRYVPVRRFFNLVEESVRKGTLPFVFEPNDANSWTKIKSMIENYLTLKWRSGALAGAKTTEAFFVHVGVPQTMTAQDILEGRIIVEIGMAVVRPAEFMILRFSIKTQNN